MQSVTLVASVIEDSVVRRDEFMNLPAASGSGQLEPRAQRISQQKYESRTRQECSNHEERGPTGHGKAIKR